MARTNGGRTRPRGSIDRLPSGSLRVRVYAGTDPVTKKRHYLEEVVPARASERGTWREAEKVRTRFVNQVDERRHPRTKSTLNQLLDQWLKVAQLERNTRTGYVGKIEKHIRPTIGSLPVAQVDAHVIETLYAQLWTCKEHCHGRKYVEHRTDKPHVCDEHKGDACQPAAPDRCQACRRMCRPHVCRPLADGSIRVIHSILKSSLNRAVRWNWIAVNPISFVEPPAIPVPDPDPPTAEEAARIVNEAWKDPDWGTLVWLAMIVGARRGELSALRWQHVDLDKSLITIGRSIGQEAGDMWEKDTKTHQKRTLTLDPLTVEVLAEHRERCESRAAALDLTIPKDGFVFSLAPDGSTPLRPDTATQRYGRLAARLGIDTRLHSLRHYSATELIASGVDPRTVAGRLGHGGGGATTLRFYSAWVPASDQQAASTLAARMPQRPAPAEPESNGASPYELLATELRTKIEDGSLPKGERLPAIKEIAAEHGVSFGTAQRAVSLLKAWGLIEIVRGHRAIVV